jgi:F-type H+-transporting ATPase subunit b
MESASITSQLGIDWRLLISQAVNFLLLLIILRLFVYKPVLNILKKRQEKIEEGIAKTEEADQRLKDVDVVSIKKVKEAEDKAMGIIRSTQERAKEKEAELLEKAKEKEAAYMKKVEQSVLAEKETARREMEKEATGLVKQALVKTVELAPDKIDEALIKRAVEQIG